MFKAGLKIDQFFAGWIATRPSLSTLVHALSKSSSHFWKDYKRILSITFAKKLLGG